METETKERDELLQVRISESLFRRVRSLAANKGRGWYPRDVVSAALEQYLPSEEEALAQQRQAETRQ